MSHKLHGDDIAAPLMQSKTYEDSEMDITPMIDITFLLLIFFIVASKMEAGADVSLPPARYGKPVPSKNAIVITLAAGENGTARVYTGNGMSNDHLVAGDAEAQEAAVSEYVEQELAEGSRQHLLIKAEKGIKHGDVTRIAKAATRAEGVEQLFIAVLVVQ
jgi:biopolymer transport protein ExbD